MAITTRASIFTNRGKGLGWSMPLIPASTQAGTAAVATASGSIACSVTWNSIGTTLPATVQGFPLPAGLPNELYVNFFHNVHNTACSAHLAYFYKMGTLDLANAAATPYDGFTHDAGWSGTLQRTILGATLTDVQLIPLIHITTVTATSAPAFKLATSAAGNGYKNQASVGVIGTKTFTLPAAATAAGSAYILRLEDGDSAITDMTQISVTTKGTTGAATIWGVEILASCPKPAARGGIADTIFGGLRMNNLAPAVASTGTVPSNLGILYCGTQANISSTAHAYGVVNG